MMRRQKKHSFIQITFFYLMMFFFGIVIVCLISEVLIRIFLPQQESVRWIKSDKKYGYVNKKNFHQDFYYLNRGFVMTVRTNSLGMRDKEYDLTHNYTKRVLLLGDSFTFGYGLNIEDIFDSKLEALLNQSGEKAIVLNAGVGGWGTLQETKYARDNFTRLKPDIVIITFCGNDLWDDFNYQNNLDLEKGLFYFPGKIFLRDHSHFFRLVVAKNHVIWWKWMRRKKIKEAKEHKKSIDEDRQSATILVEENWDNTLEAIRKFHKEFLEYNPNGIVLVQATNPLNETIRKHLKSFSNGRDLVYVDLYDDVVVLEEKERTTSLKDVHWSPKMHSISAENLYRAIRDLTPQ